MGKKEVNDIPLQPLLFLDKVLLLFHQIWKLMGQFLLPVKAHVVSSTRIFQLSSQHGIGFKDNIQICLQVGLILL